MGEEPRLAKNERNEPHISRTCSPFHTLSLYRASASQNTHTHIHTHTHVCGCTTAPSTSSCISSVAETLVRQTHSAAVAPQSILSFPQSVCFSSPSTSAHLRCCSRSQCATMLRLGAPQLRTLARASPHASASTLSPSQSSPRRAALSSAPSAPAPSAAKGYSPAATEQRWQAHWKEAALGTPRAKRAEAAAHKASEGPAAAFAMVMPPPNVTGRLHLGHALTLSVQDALARWMRLRGRDVLWLPGVDHAGIATQTVVERNLAAEGEAVPWLSTGWGSGKEEVVAAVWLPTGCGGWEGGGGGCSLAAHWLLGLGRRRRGLHFGCSLAEGGWKGGGGGCFLSIHWLGVWKGEVAAVWLPTGGGGLPRRFNLPKAHQASRRRQSTPPASSTRRHCFQSHRQVRRGTRWAARRSCAECGTGRTNAAGIFCSRHSGSAPQWTGPAPSLRSTTRYARIGNAPLARSLATRRPPYIDRPHVNSSRGRCRRPLCGCTTGAWCTATRAASTGPARCSLPLATSR